MCKLVKLSCIQIVVKVLTPVEIQGQQGIKYIHFNINIGCKQAPIKFRNWILLKHVSL